LKEHLDALGAIYKTLSVGPSRILTFIFQSNFIWCFVLFNQRVRRKIAISLFGLRILNLRDGALRLLIVFLEANANISGSNHLFFPFLLALKDYPQVSWRKALDLKLWLRTFKEVLCHNGGMSHDCKELFLFRVGTIPGLSIYKVCPSLCL